MNRLQELHTAGVSIWLRVLADARSAGLDLDAITAELKREREGVASFCASYRRLLERIEDRAAQMVSAPLGPAA